MKDKTRKALKGLLKHVAAEEAADPAWPYVDGVNKEDLKRLMRWAQNESYAWFEGDRVELTGARVPFPWLEGEVQGTVLEDTGEDGIACVEWDGAPKDNKRVKMYHNEIKRVK